MANQSLGTIREFKTKNFRVLVDAIEDWDVDLSFDETGETERRLENGTLISFAARARVFFRPTGQELGRDYLGGCIYESLDAFQDHRECGLQNRRRLKQEGHFQIYRKNRPYESCLSASDKLKKRGLATREKAIAWAQANATEAWEVFETGKCGSYFADMISTAITRARKALAGMQSIRVRVSQTSKSTNEVQS
jgi:hypothetical protein